MGISRLSSKKGRIPSVVILKWEDLPQVLSIYLFLYFDIKKIYRYIKKDILCL